MQRSMICLILLSKFLDVLPAFTFASTIGNFEVFLLKIIF